MFLNATPLRCFVILASLAILNGCQIKAPKNSTTDSPITTTRTETKSGENSIVSAKKTLPPAPISPKVPKASRSEKFAAEECYKRLKALPGKTNEKELREACKEVHQLPSCVSESGTPIFHYERASTKENAKRILTFALIHGDEAPSGSVARAWIERLSDIDPRNTWRVVPILNPDGLTLNTRTNKNKVDINRNFPTDDWNELAMKWWKKKTKSDKRRFPGDKAASEKETLCAMEHINEFNPSFIISLHTPYGVLDFDGPRIQVPKFSPLPWISLGNYPGSLGRYMWVGKQVPVLTIELKGNRAVTRLEDFDRLQDISGAIAIQAEKILNGPRSFSPDAPKSEEEEEPKKKPQPKSEIEAESRLKPLNNKRSASVQHEYI